MGTRIQVSEIQEILNDPSLDTDGQPDVVSEIQDYIQSQGVIVTKELVQHVIFDIEGLGATGTR